MTKREIAMGWFFLGFFVGVVATAATAYILFSMIWLQIGG